MRSAALDPSCRCRSAIHGRVWWRQPTELGPRVVAEHLLLAIEAGRIVARCGEQRLGVEAGRFIWVQPGVEHHVTTVESVTPTRIRFCRFLLAARRPLRLRESTLCGPADAFFLSKQFKDVYGLSPRGWRRSQG